MKTRIAHRLRMRSKLKRVVLVYSLFTFLLSSGLFIYLNLANKKDVSAAVTNEYRSVASGNWNVLSSWQRYNGSSWVAATAVPTSAHNIITIQSGHIITITSNVTVDQVVISAGGSVYLNSGITMTVANGTGTDFKVSGTFRNAGTVVRNSSATLSFLNAGVYQHNYTTTAGTIPTASWATGSTCEIIGYTTNTATPSGLQSFYNFTWNCTNQSNAISLNGGLTTVNGNFLVASTGSNEFRLATNGSTLNIGLSLSQTGGTFTLSTGSSQTSTMNISENFSLSGGIFTVVNGSASTGNINLSGNYSHTGGTLTHGGNVSTSARIAFAKSGTQIFTSPSTDVQQNIDFVVNSTSTLDMGTDICHGRNFTLSSGAGIILASPDGISSSGLTGNVQVTGTRSFHTGAQYTYDGTLAQVPGNGLPASIYRLTIDNNAGLTLQSNLSVTNRLTLTNGRIFTGSNELYLTSSSTSGITGQSNNSYVVGNLRRALSATGTFEFPLGSNSMYELMTVTVSAATGFSSLLGTFENANPVEVSYPLLGLQASYIDLDSMLNYGYWTLTPNSGMTGGTFSLNLMEQGYSNSVSAKSVFSVVRRTNTSSAWQTVGAHTDASPALNGGVATAIRTGLNSFNHFAIAYGQFLAFENPSLIAGTGGQVGAIYLFPNVCGNVDAWMEIMELAGGATLDAIDNSSTGYNEAFQPFVDIAPNGTSSIQWKITFKVSGTSIDTTLAKMTMTGVDIDGGSNIREFIEATMPYSYSLDPLTTLTVLNLLGSYRAISSFATVTNIDTSQHQAMYQLNYRNVNSILYRTGGISTKSSVETRQTSLYFRSFLTGSIALPIKLSYFNAKLNDNKVDLNWATSSEINNDYFSVERSEDGMNFESVATIQGAGNSTNMLYYETVDREPIGGHSYYRLKQTDYDGKYTFSQIVTVKNGKSKVDSDLRIQSVFPNPFSDRFTVGFTKKVSGPVKFVLLNGAGRMISQSMIDCNEGYNNYQFESKQDLVSGVYFIMLLYDDKKVVQKVIKE